MYGVDILYFA